MFRDRQDAGIQLAGSLREFASTNTIVLGLPRGGVPVANEVAASLGLPLEVLVCRKLGVPGHEEFAFGAISEGGVRFLDENTVRAIGLNDDLIENLVKLATQELNKRVIAFRAGRPITDLRGKTALIIDDGVATGATARAACLAARKFGALRIVVAVPVGPVDAQASLPEADEVICLSQPEPFVAVGNHYENFDQVSDAEVARILTLANRTI